MMTSIQACVRKGRHTLRALALDPRVHRGAKWIAWAGAGFLFSAASLNGLPQALALGLVCASGGGWAALAALGAALGYRVFWGSAGDQCLVWVLLALPCAFFLGEKRIARETPLLLPAIAALIVSATGVAYQAWLGDTTPVPMYLLRVGLGAASAWLFARVRERRGPVLDWLAWGFGVLALAQVVPIPFLGLGFLAGGALGVGGAFPAAALAGLALDLAQVTRVPMAAVLCLAWFLRLLPGQTRWSAWLGPGLSYLVVCAMSGLWDPAPLPGLLLGGIAGLYLPAQSQLRHRRGETGVIQVRLEMVAACMSQAQQLLVEAAVPPIDEAALLSRSLERACGNCPCRKTCQGREHLEPAPGLLHQSLLSPQDLPWPCRKPGRMLSELRRCQEQLRAIRGDRARQGEYREAVIQQYQFLAGYLRELSDALSRRTRETKPRFQAEVAVCANRPQGENGDRCLWFAGTECRYYVLLCDGMGVGPGAVAEGNSAGKLLRRLLTAGFPAEHALRSLNSLCALRGQAGAVTVDLAEIQLDTGRTAIYKWGAAPSYLVTKGGVEKIGTAGPPPGLSVADGRETVERLSLRRGETLVLLSDGVGGEDALRGWAMAPETPPGEMAARFLEHGEGAGTDDATVAVVRLTGQVLNLS